MHTYTSGSGVEVAPSGVTICVVELCASGGPGARGRISGNEPSGGGGGGSGGYAKTSVACTAGDTFPWLIGLNYQNSVVSGGTISTMTCTPGGMGMHTSPYSGGAGGAASGGSITNTGGNPGSDGGTGGPGTGGAGIVGTNGTGSPGGNGTYYNGTPGTGQPGKAIFAFS
ncbi:MAG: hypothetical protein ACREDR_00270 [Blastocatellia bacterium]